MEVGGVLISSEILTECFCCDYEKCKGICCVEGDAGAPVTMDEIAGIEEALDHGMVRPQCQCTERHRPSRRSLYRQGRRFGDKHRPG